MKGQVLFHFVRSTKFHNPLGLFHREPTHLSNIETGTTRVSLTVIVRIANALGVTTDDLLCDNIVKAKVQFDQDIALVLEDCDEYEIRVIRDIVAATKETLRRNAHLRNRTDY